MAVDWAHLQATARLQPDSSLFGRLPPEIREMVYAECWAVSGLDQHVYRRDGRLYHFPCQHSGTDRRNEQFEPIWKTTRRRSRCQSSLADETWAARLSSPWHDHWECEEAMVSAGKPTGTLFLPLLLACKRT